MMVRRRALLLGVALAVAILGATGAVIHHRMVAAAERAAASELLRQAAERREREKREQELSAGLDQYAKTMIEARFFSAWIRELRPKILAGKTRSALPEVECQSSQGGARNSTCSLVHFPRGAGKSLRWELSWYRNRPDDMRATGSGLTHSPLMNCEALGLRQRLRYTEQDGQVTILHCEIPDSKESYAMRLARRADSGEMTLFWYSSGYLDRDASARRMLHMAER